MNHSSLANYVYESILWHSELDRAEAVKRVEDAIQLACLSAVNARREDNERTKAIRDSRAKKAKA